MAGFADILGLPAQDATPPEGGQEGALPQGFAGMVGGLPPGMPQAGAPATPQEHAERVAGWTGFLTNLQQNPQMQQVLMTVGGRLLQGRHQGQSTGGAIGEALQLGMLHKSMLDENQRAARLAERKMQMEEQQHAAQTAESQARTAESTTMLPTKAKKAQLEIQRLEAELPNAKTAAEVKGLQLKLEKQKADFQAALAADPNGTTMESAWLAEAQKPTLDAEKEGAATAKLRADTGYTGAHQALAEAQTDAVKEGRGKGGGTGGSSAQVLNRKDLEARLKEADPELAQDSKKLNKAVLDYERTQKKKDDQAGFMDYVAKGGVDISTPESLDKALMAYEKLKTRFGDSSAPAAAGTPTAAPPMAARVVGKVYQTPKGPMTWTGSGWKPS